MHRSHFCTMGALSDIFLMGSATRLRQWVLTVAVAILGFGAMAGLGLISPQNTIYANTSLSFVSLGLGGLLFGSGMVLASGCISKSLTRLGAGNLKSLVVLLVVGVSALATMRGLPAVWRVHALDPISLPLSHGAFVGQWVGIAGPRGSLVIPTGFDWHWLIGDETALPAIARRLRSRDWFDNRERMDMTALYLERFMNYGVTPEELQSGKPIIGIAQTGSDLTPCNRHHLELAKRVRDGIRDAGGIAIEFPALRSLALAR